MHTIQLHPPQPPPPQRPSPPLLIVFEAAWTNA
jgi:hypothetical protein